jgi:cation:H+ antiporter
MTGHLVQFLASGAVVVAAGIVLAKAGDAIAARTGLGRLWVGALLLAGATSLPELATDITAVRIGAPDLAAGDLFGSSMANILILAIVDLVPPRGRVLRGAAFEHVLAGALAIILNGLAAAFVLVRIPTALFGRVGVDAVFLFGLYVAGMRAVYVDGRVAAAVAVASEEQAGSRAGLRGALVRFGLAAAAILAAAPGFARAAQGIAEESGLGGTFVGTLLVGLATSLPELASSLAAIRIGAADLAIGNLLGSNGFNMAVFLVLDLAQPGPFFAVLDPAHAITGLFAVVLMALGVGALVYRAERRVALLEPSSLGILAGYVLAVSLLYARATGRG